MPTLTGRRLPAIGGGRSVTFHGFADFAARAPEVLERDLDGLTTGLLQATAAMAVNQVLIRTPRAAKKSAWAKRQGVPTSQHMQDRWWLQVGGGARLIKRAAGFTVAQRIKRLVTVVIGNDAKYAEVIDRGLSVVTRMFKKRVRSKDRTMSIHRPTRSKPYITGSPKAPRGILIPTREVMEAQFDALAEGVIKRIESGRGAL